MPDVEKRWTERYGLNTARIRLSEDTEEVCNDTGQVAVITRYWIASVNCYTVKMTNSLVEVVGPTVEMSRTGDSAAEAYKILVEALTEQGFEVWEQ